MDTTEKQLQEWLRSRSEIERCAYVWWKQHKPLAWSFMEHLSNPTVNCATWTDKDIARAIADALSFVHLGEHQ